MDISIYSLYKINPRTSRKSILVILFPLEFHLQQNAFSAEGGIASTQVKNV